MDNKRWNNRFGTIFWWCVTIAPILIIIWAMIVALVNYNRLGGTAENQTTIYNYCKNFIYQNENNNIFTLTNGLYTIVPNFLKTSMKALFGIILQETSEASDILGNMISYMVWIQLIHLLYDFLKWVPNMAHELIECKGGLKK